MAISLKAQAAFKSSLWTPFSPDLKAKKCTLRAFLHS